MPEPLLALSQRQAMTLSRRQILGASVSDRVISRWVAEGRLAPLTRGIYSLGEGGWRQLAWAGVLLGGDTAVLGLASAAYLDGLVREPPEQITVFVGPDAQVRRNERWRFVSSRRVGRGAPPRTWPAKTIVDMAPGLGADALAALVAEALGHQKTSAEGIMTVLDATARNPARTILTEIVTDVGHGARSALEVRYARDVERAHALPPSKRQQGPADKLTDVWYEAYKLLVELDGRAYHRGVAAWRDMGRDNLHHLLSTATLRYPWIPVATTPCEVAREVAQALTMRGWTGTLRPCRRCAPRPC